MKNLLEKAIIHLLNNDEERASSLFHKFMIEKARVIHESLRQDEDVNLDNNWDDETKSEEYFDNDDMGDSDEPHDDVDMDISAEDDGMDGDVDIDADVDTDDMDIDGEDGEVDTADIRDKLDDIESQIHELTAEFDRLMGDEGVGDEDVDVDVDMDGDEFETSDEGEDDLNDLEDEDPDLADRMDTDMSSEDEPEYEDDIHEDDENLDDITESVLSELDRISSPGNTDGQEIGSGGKKITGNKTSNLPNHGVNDRIAGAKPYLVKGGNNDSMARETPPTSKGVDTLVKGARNSMARYDSKFEKKSKEGDGSAKLNSDFAGSEAKSKSPIGDGNPAKPKTK